MTRRPKKILQCSLKRGELDQNIWFTDLNIREGEFIGMTSEGSPESEDLAQWTLRETANYLCVQIYLTHILSWDLLIQNPPN